MAAIATYLRNVLVVGVPAVVAAIFLIAANRARTPVVSASVVIIISHMHLPSSIGFCSGRKNLSSSRYTPRPSSLAITKL
jgi:hypothetical protein